MLMHDAFSDVSTEDSNIVLDGNSCQIMSDISEAYSNAESWQPRREILSIVAPKISLKLMQLFVPGLTRLVADFQQHVCMLKSMVSVLELTQLQKL